MRLEGIRKGEEGWATRILFRVLRRRRGGVPSPLRIYAWRPAILWGFLRLSRAVRREGELAPRLRGLAMYWTARNVECAF